MKSFTSLFVFLFLTIRYRNYSISLITGTIFVINLIFLFYFSSHKREKIDLLVENEDVNSLSENINKKNPTNREVKTLSIINIASLLSSFTDIQYCALKSLKNSYIESSFPAEIGTELDREAFCAYCLSEDLIRFSTPEEDKRLIKIQECKDYLKKASLRVSGNKADLVQRISDFNPTFFGSQRYVITDKGQQLLENHRTLRRKTSIPAELSLDQKMQKYSISYKEFSVFKKHLPFSASENDIIWGILNQKIVSYSHVPDFYAVRNAYLAMALLSEDECNYEQSLEFFIVTICFDVNGCSSNERPCLIQWISDRVFYLRAYYNACIPIVAYSKCYANKPFFSENTFTLLIESIISSSDRLSYTECEELLAYFL